MCCSILHLVSSLCRLSACPSACRAACFSQLMLRLLINCLASLTQPSAVLLSVRFMHQHYSISKLSRPILEMHDIVEIDFCLIPCRQKNTIIFTIIKKHAIIFTTVHRILGKTGQLFEFRCCVLLLYFIFSLLSFCLSSKRYLRA